jgi:hypothetical protein
MTIPPRGYERDPRLESVLLYIQHTGETPDSEMRAVAIKRGLAFYSEPFDLLCLTRQGRRLLREADLA